MLEPYLSKFEASVDLAHQQAARRKCQKIFAFEPVKTLPFIWRNGGAEGAAHIDSPIDTDWPRFPYNDAFYDPSKMLLNQLYAPFIHNQLKDDHPLNIRCNFGTVILPSIFGVGYQLTETSLPWCHHLTSRDAVRRLIANGIPDPHSGLGGRCFETADYYREVLADYPKLAQAVAIYHPDMQGPFDVAHLIWGPDIFVALYDCPELVHELLTLVTETYIVWMKQWKAFIGEGNDFTTHWNFYIKGGIMVRDDTPVMLSLAHYETFVKPYDQQLLDEFGGCIHFCGKADYLVPSMCESRNLYGIHSSQPELNDMRMIKDAAFAQQIALLGVPEAYVSELNIKTGTITLRNTKN
jgi:hypothetical protein